MTPHHISVLPGTKVVPLLWAGVVEAWLLVVEARLLELGWLELLSCC
jgi:hypothetical protein